MSAGGEESIQAWCVLLRVPQKALATRRFGPTPGGQESCGTQVDCDDSGAVALAGLRLEQAGADSRLLSSFLSASAPDSL